MIIKQEFQKGTPRKFINKVHIKTYLFLIPSLLGVAIFFVLPFLLVIFYSFADNPISLKFVGLQNYSMLLQNAAFRLAVRNTVFFSGTAVILSTGLSVLLAVILERNIPMKSFIRTCFLTPLMVPTASIVLIWQVFFHYNGTFNSLLINLGAGQLDWFKSEYSLAVVLLLFLWKNLGYNMVLFMAALGEVPREVLEVITLDGGTEFQKFIYIKLRYLSPTILFVAILTLVSSFKIFKEVYLLTGAHPYDTLYLLQHFMNNAFLSLDYQKLSTAAVLMAIVVIGIVGILFFIEDRVGRDLEG